MLKGKRMRERLKACSFLVERGLSTLLRDASIPPRLSEAMRYSLLAGGKRIRPVLCLMWSKMLGNDLDTVLPFACGLECIHTYSLIHDDLPAMDDDALRRGKPTSHVAYGEALAILSGDGLLTEAFFLMLSVDLEPGLVLRAAREVARAAGPAGMVGGQVLDMELTGSGSRDMEGLRMMHALKTGALIRSACLSGAILADADSGFEERAARYGAAIGLAFQVVDDILDVVGDEQLTGKPVGSDSGQGKVTYPGLLGIDQSRELARSLRGEAQDALLGINGPEKDFLHDLAHYIIDRME